MPTNSPPRTQRRKRKIPLRRWLRAFHRDAGYLVVGLTFVYALSGLAVNHIGDWDPNFTPIDKTTTLTSVGLHVAPEDDPARHLIAARRVLEELGREQESRKLKPEDVYVQDDSNFEITLKNTTLFIDLAKAEIREEGQAPRPLLRIANWLHLNRGKEAWTYVADAYAILLLYLAGSGLFMFSGRKGLFGRAGLLALVGAAVPVAYVILSGGP